MKIRIAVLVMAFVAIGAGEVPAQALDSLRTEATRSRGFIRGAETQLTKVLDLIERIEVNPDGTVDTIYASDLVPEEAPPEWRVEEPEADSTSPPWVGDGRQLYQFWAWGDSSVAWADAGGDTLRMTWLAPTDKWVNHIWPVFQRGTDLWLPSGDGWLPARVHASRPWVCVDPGDEAESYSFTERVVASGIALGLKVADWTIGVDSTFAQGLDRLPPECPEAGDIDIPSTSPSDVTLSGYAAPNMTHPRENGLLVQWDTPPAGTDSIVVDGGPNGPGDTFSRTLPGTATMVRQPLAYDSVTSMWSCVKYQKDGVNGPQKCNSSDWAPMMRSFLAVTMRVGEAPLAAGDSVNLNLDRVDGGWGDGSVMHPDSVVFETGDVRHREQAFPYEFPCDVDDEGCLYAVPAGDSLVVKWTVFEGAGSKGGSVAYPIQ